MTHRIALSCCALLLAMVPIAQAQAPAATQPAAKYRLSRQTVAGSMPQQWVVVITTPSGAAYIGTPDKLQWCIETAVPKGAVLEWDAGCCRIGDEPPIDTAAVTAFCIEREIRFVVLPGG